MKKVVLKVEVFDEKTKRKAMKAVSGMEGVESLEMNMKEKRMTVIGDIDPVSIVSKLRKCCPTHILTVGPLNNSKGDVALLKTVNPMNYYDNYHQYQPSLMSSQYFKPVAEEDRNGCVIS